MSDYLNAFTEWYNNQERLTRRYGKFSEVTEVKVEESGCGNGTCQWDVIRITGYDADDANKERVVELGAENISEFLGAMYQDRVAADERHKKEAAERVKQRALELRRQHYKEAFGTEMPEGGINERRITGG